MPVGGGADPTRRFGGVARLYGDAGLARLAAAHVVVVGVGGVGSWSAEALARCGVGRLTLVDLDHLSESNINRQVHALDSTLGTAKVVAMATRIADIAPACQVRQIDDHVAPDNLDTLQLRADAMIDAIDSPRAKAALIAWCCRHQQPLIVCGAAGGRTDPLRLRRDDLASTRGDALLAGVRARLRRDYGFPREAGRRFGVSTVFSDEPTPPGTQACSAPGGVGGAPLGCAGYGSLVAVTATMGLAAAQWTIDRLVHAKAIVATGVSHRDA
jgi:tRNA A37 threonylcarbamoyladenosine dehydratase